MLTELFGAGWPAPHRVVRNAATDRWLGTDSRGPGWLRAFHRMTAPAFSRIPVRAQFRLAATQRAVADLDAATKPRLRQARRRAPRQRDQRLRVLHDLDGGERDHDLGLRPVEDDEPVVHEVHHYHGPDPDAEPQPEDFPADEPGYETEPGAVMDGASVEHIVDAARVLGRYADALGVRSFPRGTDWAVARKDAIIRSFDSGTMSGYASWNSVSTKRHPSLKVRKTVRPIWFARL